jgi:hypothetical protein
VKELQALGLKVELLKFKEDVAPEERVTIEEGVVEAVELTSRIEAEVAAEGENIALEIAEMQEPTTETADEVVAGIEEGAESDAFGETAKDEVEDAASEEAMEDA